MNNFAKLFNTDKGQILVKLDDNDEGKREIRFYCQPEGFGVNSVAFAYKDGDEEAADAGFDKIDQEMAEKAVKEIYDLCGLF